MKREDAVMSEPLPVAGPVVDPVVGPVVGPVVDPVVDLWGVEKTYANGTQALAETTLKFKEGEFISLLGPSGCGKSTLLKMIAGLTEPSNGKIRWWNRGLDQIGQPGRKMVMVFQDATLMPWAKVGANVRLPLELAGQKGPEADRAVADALKLVGLDKFEQSYPRELSGGMQMRASIARALVTDPNLLLMDEPFGALDEIVRDHLNAALLKLWARTNKTICFVTHSIPEAVYLSTKIVVMSPRPGRVTDVIDSTLPSERPLDIRETPEFLEIAHRVREGLRAGHSYEQ
jgi:NitT/TauT family transport system ATP-binding protein